MSAVLRCSQWRVSRINMTTSFINREGTTGKYKLSSLLTVGAEASRSLPPVSTGIDCIWIGVGSFQSLASILRSTTDKVSDGRSASWNCTIGAGTLEPFTLICRRLRKALTSSLLEFAVSWRIFLEAFSSSLSLSLSLSLLLFSASLSLSSLLALLPADFSAAEFWNRFRGGAWPWETCPQWNQ